MLRRALPLTVSAALVLTTTACGGGDDEGSAATTAPPTTEAPTTTTPPDPFAVPAEIDEAYVELVINELYRLTGDALRGVVQAGEVTDDAVAQVEAVFGARLAQSITTEFEGMARASFSGVERPPGNAVADVQRIRSVDDECIFVDGTLDNRALLVQDQEPVNLVMVLRRNDGAGEATEANPTPWRLVATRAPEGFEEEADGCDAY